MSQLSPDQNIDVQIDQIDRGPSDLSDGHYPPHPAQDQISQRLSHSSDTSIPLFALHLRITEEHDERRRELLRADADQILVFCGLFSATLAALVVPWFSDPTTSSPSSESLSPKASQDVINANLLWLYSLLVSISCALTALSLQQWIRLGATLSHHSLPEQVRLGAILAARIERSKKLIKGLHGLIFVSILIFFLGLLFFFWAVSRPIFHTALIWAVLFFAYHAYAQKSTVSLRPSSPSYTLFTQAKAEEQVPHTDGDGDVLKRTLNMLRSDDDLEQFFESIPGFLASKIVNDPRRSLDILGRQRLAETLVAFWNRTLSSNRASESVKGQRLVVCMRLIEAAELSIAIPQILHLFSVDPNGASQSAEIGHTLRILRNGKTAPLSRGVVASIIPNAERNDRWFALAMDELGISRDVLQGYIAHGDSVLLANLIHITRQFFHSLLQHDLDLTVTTRTASSLLPSVSKFDILNAVPELQHDFCALWNEIVQQVQNSEADINSFIDILVEIRHLYVALHGTDATLGEFLTPTTGHDDRTHQRTSYPFCMIPDHRNNLTPDLEEVSCNTVGRASHPTATTSPILSESSPRDVLVTHHTTTGITPIISDTPISSMARPVAHSL